MTSEFFKKIFNLLLTAYPNYSKKLSEKEIINIQNLWFNLFKNEDDNLFKKSILLTIKTNRFFPSVADIYEQIKNLNQTKQPTVWELWRILEDTINQISFKKNKACIHGISQSKLHYFWKLENEYYPKIKEAYEYEQKTQKEIKKMLEKFNVEERDEYILSINLNSSYQELKNELKEKNCQCKHFLISDEFNQMWNSLPKVLKTYIGKKERLLNLLIDFESTTLRKEFSFFVWEFNERENVKNYFQSQNERF